MMKEPSSSGHTVTKAVGSRSPLELSLSSIHEGSITDRAPSPSTVNNKFFFFITFSDFDGLFYLYKSVFARILAPGTHFFSMQAVHIIAAQESKPGNNHSRARRAVG